MLHKEDDQQDIKRMADMLRQGSTLTELACPACSSPLFRLRNGDLWCAKCQKKVVVIKEEAEEARIHGSMILENLETTLLTKIQSIQDKMQHTEDQEELQKLSTTLSELLENLERLRKTKKP